MRRYLGTIHAYKDYRGQTFHSRLASVRLPTGHAPVGMPRVYNVNVYLK